MSDLASRKCVPCEGGTPPMARGDAVKLLSDVSGWELIEEGVLKIRRKFKFKDFKEALLFVNKIGGIAEEEGHHPDIEFGWGRASITLNTHAVSGLSENDFIMAAKINEIYG